MKYCYSLLSKLVNCLGLSRTERELTQHLNCRSVTEISQKGELLSHVMTNILATEVLLGYHREVTPFICNDICEKIINSWDQIQHLNNKQLLWYHRAVKLCTSCGTEKNKVAKSLYTFPSEPCSQLQVNQKSVSL